MGTFKANPVLYGKLSIIWIIRMNSLVILCKTNCLERIAESSKIFMPDNY